MKIWKKKKTWKNLDTDSCFDENWKSHKPARPPPAAHYLMISLALISGDAKAIASARALASWQGSQRMS